jgi:hypothetical protein
MTTSGLSPQVLQHRLSDHAVHVDFLRLRCGSEKRFADGVEKVRAKSLHQIHTFVSFSEWDAVVVVPCSELYPQTLTEIYSNVDVASSVSGTSGYFAYLWEHNVNENWRERLTHFEGSGPSILVSLRFADWFRRDVGVGAEILFCSYLEILLKSFPGVKAVVAHSLGWNDVVLLVHADDKEKLLTKVLSRVRLTTLGQCIEAARDYDIAATSGKKKRTHYGFTPRELGFSHRANTQIFAASYTHLLGGLGNYNANKLSLGALATQIQSARVLVRVAPPHESRVRKFMSDNASRIGVKFVPSEMGHYSLSFDISKLNDPVNGGRQAIAFIAKTRNFIGSLSKQKPDSYAETTTIFRFLEPSNVQRKPPATPISKDLQQEIETVEYVMKTLPDQLLKRQVSAMTAHRFVSVLLTLLDHLSDPVRSSVVRHLSRFARTIPEIVGELDADGIDDLCHVLEYAVGQAIDGIAQFQHDANALGLSGRGGYSRLIVAVEWYIRGTFALLGMGVGLRPLITFGLRSGNAGSTGRYQIDIPFNVLFVPSRWHILFHEIGHLAWLSTFGWMMESLAIYLAMENEIRIDVRREKKKTGKPKGNPKWIALERVHVEFLRVREIVRELFPSYLMFSLPCAGKIHELDAVALRRLMTMRHPTSVNRELFLIVVMHCLLEMIREAMEPGGVADPRQTKDASRRAAKWWSIWDALEHETAGKRDDRIRVAIRSVSNTMLAVYEEARLAVRKKATTLGSTAEDVGRERLEARPAAKMQILQSASFSDSVKEALHSVIALLRLRGAHFHHLERNHIGRKMFGTLLEKIVLAQDEQSDPDYQNWMGSTFAEWLHDGEVVGRHRDPFVWSRLLLGSRSQLIGGSAGSFMRSQLSVLLSMWHDAITEMYKTRKAEETLKKLGVVRDKEIMTTPSVPAVPARTRRGRQSLLRRGR